MKFCSKSDISENIIGTRGKKTWKFKTLADNLLFILSTFRVNSGFSAVNSELDKKCDCYS